MMLSMVLLFVAAPLVFVCAQVPSIDTTGATTGPFLDGSTNLGEMVQWYHILYGALVVLWGYVAKAFGLQTKVKEFVFVVLAGGLVLIGAFVALGFGGVFPYLFSFLSAIGVYDLILRPGGNMVSRLGTTTAPGKVQ